MDVKTVHAAHFSAVTLFCGGGIDRYNNKYLPSLSIDVCELNLLAV